MQKSMNKTRIVMAHRLEFIVRGKQGLVTSTVTCLIEHAATLVSLGFLIHTLKA